MQELFDKVDTNDQVIVHGLSESELHINNDITRVTTAYVTELNSTPKCNFSELSEKIYYCNFI